MVTDRLGNRMGQRVTPIDSVGLYVPGGKAAYPSSGLMSAMPAKVAGVRQIEMVVPTPGGEKNPLVLAAASLCGVTRAYAVGGAQAVAALAYGTKTIPCVDKIVGPGNAYVAAAKRHVFGRVGIDMIAGPSEILVICDGGTNPDWIAMDLFSQAEHDELAQAVLLTSRTARFSSPLGVYDFQKRTSMLHVSEEGVQVLGRIASTLAEGESLTAHAQSARYRLK